MTISIVGPGTESGSGFPLTYPGHIPAEEIFGRVMGPDAYGGLYRVVLAEHVTRDPLGDEPVRTTRAWLKGVTPDELKRRTRDDFGQVWVRP